MRSITSIILTFVSLIVVAQPPESYYQSSFGEKKEALKTAMKNIIRDHAERTYGNLWTDFQSTDNKGNNVVWDMYSDVPDGTPAYVYHYTGNQCGNYSREGDCYNREHSVPQSWFNGATPMYTDLFHLYPTDGYVNNRRDNYPFGEVGNASWISTNGSKLGASSFPGYSKTVFEPIDEYKGDFARTYFYMVTCYEDVVSSWNCDMLAKNKYPAFTSWAQNLLLKWSREDQVSQKEIDRNNAVYAIQNNRNPFIDYPQLAEYIWGDSIEYVFNPNISTDIIQKETNIPTIYHVSGTLYIDNLVTQTTVEIINLFGNKLIQTTNTGNISVHLPQGLYIVRLMYTNGNVHIHKIAIQ